MLKNMLYEVLFCNEFLREKKPKLTKPTWTLLMQTNHFNFFSNSISFHFIATAGREELWRVPAVVDLPTPPLPEATAIISSTPSSRSPPLLEKPLIPPILYTWLDTINAKSKAKSLLLQITIHGNIYRNMNLLKTDMEIDRTGRIETMRYSQRELWAVLSWLQRQRRAVWPALSSSL